MAMRGDMDIIRTSDKIDYKFKHTDIFNQNTCAIKYMSYTCTNKLVGHSIHPLPPLSPPSNLLKIVFCQNVFNILE